MSEFIVHSIPGSPFGRAALTALEEKGARYSFSPLAPGGLRSPEHLARHPFGRVPVLEHDDFQLYETQAILRYVDRVLPAPALTPADPKVAARMDQVMNIHDWYLFQGVLNVIGFQRIIKPRLMGQPADEAAVEAALPQRPSRCLVALAGAFAVQYREQPGIWHPAVPISSAHRVHANWVCVHAANAGRQPLPAQLIYHCCDQRISVHHQSQCTWLLDSAGRALVSAALAHLY